MALPRSHPNVLAGPYLERAAHWRKDEERLRAALADPATLFVPVWQARSAVVASSDGRASAYFATGAQTFAGLDASGFILLGEFHEHVVFAVVLAGEAPPALASGAELHDLRLIAGELPAEEAGLARLRASHGPLARAQSLLRPLRLADDRRCKAVTSCNAPRCAHQQFPRLDPAVIVLVTDGERALLGRQPAWPPGRYSTDRRLRRARGKPGGRGRARGPRGNGRDRRRGRVSLVAALAVPVLADARLHRARQPDGHRPERRGAGGRPLVHPRADRSRRDRAADDTLDLVPPDRGLVRQRGEHAAAGGAGRADVAAAAKRTAEAASGSVQPSAHSVPLQLAFATRISRIRVLYNPAHVPARPRLETPPALSADPRRQSR